MAYSAKAEAYLAKRKGRGSSSKPKSNWRNDAPSDAQLGTIAKNAKRKVLSTEDLALVEAGTFTKGEASDLIDRIFKAPFKSTQRDEPSEAYSEADSPAGWNPTPIQEQRREVPEPLGVGVYELDGEVYIVKQTKDKERLYAKRLIEITGDRLTEADSIVQIEFEYARGAIYKLRPEHKMPLDKAKELTIRYGRCIVCGRHLKAAESVERGIGPVCIKSFR